MGEITIVALPFLFTVARRFLAVTGLLTMTVAAWAAGDTVTLAAKHIAARSMIRPILTGKS